MRILIPLIILVFGFSIFGQTKRLNKSLKDSIYQYAEKCVLTLNNSNDMNYRVESKNTFYADVDDDGDFDAIIEIFFCEKSNCHPTTQSSKIAVFINQKSRYIFTAEKNFVLFGKISSITKNRIFINIYDLEEDDPQCCPVLKRNEIYIYKSAKLIKSNK